MQLQKVLLPVDGSDHSFRAAEYAAELVLKVGGDIVLMHCHRSYPVSLGEPYFQKIVSKTLTQANQMLTPFRDLLQGKQIAFEERILEGNPGQVIADVAGIEKCDLIVMGSRGRSDLQGLLLGSVTHRVLHAAACPVLVVR